MHEKCKALFNRISEYLDGELDSSICKEIEDHLRECPECERCLDSLKRTVALCKELSKEGVPREVHERLKKSLMAYLSR
ncbi:MAG: zf-HC2 domain-containing protein [Deltaproteobacteria bacterium]|nr:zf-HC2 domain-containing protein [Deltaproteobacteria bacterium]MBW2017535.1 zf-HC2 domain-containing protein [Deltaproteobacteria bacterium]MBW2128051.1 zf-HC2 domain-containing protein [Deltaproteobacteria bacterium]MBW2304071.1 zf-HC2 domain-containing protein [Deltaproteobacteria bacterium]